MEGFRAEDLKYFLPGLRGENARDKSRVTGANEIIYWPTQKAQGDDLNLNSAEESNE